MRAGDPDVFISTNRTPDIATHVPVDDNVVERIGRKEDSIVRLQNGGEVRAHVCLVAQYVFPIRFTEYAVIVSESVARPGSAWSLELGPPLKSTECRLLLSHRVRHIPVRNEWCADLVLSQDTLLTISINSGRGTSSSQHGKNIVHLIPVSSLRDEGDLCRAYCHIWPIRLHNSLQSSLS
jgi:hypothetical protein